MAHVSKKRPSKKFIVGEMYKTLKRQELYDYAFLDFKNDADDSHDVAGLTMFQLIEITNIQDPCLFGDKPSYDMKILTSDQQLGWITMTKKQACREIVCVIPEKEQEGISDNASETGQTL
jgi:hypothetical protein